jgi:hypothetical protein
MKKFIIEESEKDRILSLHKNLLSEQTQSNDREKLEGYINAKCLTGGDLYRESNNYKFYYGRKTKNNDGYVKFFADDTYEVIKNDGTKSTSTYSCQKYMDVVTKTTSDKEKIDGNWKTKQELMSSGVDENDINDTTLYEKHPSKDWYKLKKSTSKLGDLSSRTTTIGTKMKDLTGQINFESCKKIIDYYYSMSRDTQGTGAEALKDPEFKNFKRNVQSCINYKEGKKGIFNVVGHSTTKKIEVLTDPSKTPRDWYLAKPLDK